MATNGSYFKLFNGTNGNFYWTLYAPNHEPICQSEGYTTKASAENGIRAVKVYAPVAEVIDQTSASRAAYR